ncbi:hypothetical protein M0R45_025370 [Rubus argutus]|uniref:NB-ARC domain-containing protein n=1 Tax=Rubus argutus TaxID=59490 RepID=A0AAW1WTZ7_RUBAR
MSPDSGVTQILSRIQQGLCPEDRLEKLGRTLKKCGGLPLAIKTIGSLLASKVDSPSQWRRVLESFHTLTTEGKTTQLWLLCG